MQLTLSVVYQKQEDKKMLVKQEFFENPPSRLLDEIIESSLRQMVPAAVSLTG